MHQVLFLLRRMYYLENLTLYLRTKGGNRIIDDAFVQNEILSYMPQLHSFTFYISTHANIRDLSHTLPEQDICVERGNSVNIVNRVSPYDVVCSIFSLPFVFDYLADLGNLFPDIVFSNVTYLFLLDVYAFGHEFFVRISRLFPLLKYLRIFNLGFRLLSDPVASARNPSQLKLTIEYPNLTSLDMALGHEDYHEQFLDERKAYVPRLTELKVYNEHLKTVTSDFTREATRRNCTKVTRLIVEPFGNSEEYSHYFPSL